MFKRQMILVLGMVMVLVMGVSGVRAEINVVALGFNPGDFTNAMAFQINENNQVVGEGIWSSGVYEAVIWENVGGTWQYTILPRPSLVTRAIAWDINDAGHVVGMAYDADWYPHAAVWTKTGSVWGVNLLTSLNPSGDNTSNGYGINNLGQVVGNSRGSDLVMHPCVWEGGSITDLGATDHPGGTAREINESGVIGGLMTATNGRTHAGRWTKVGGVWQQPENLGTLIGDTSYSEGSDINAAGTVVGWSSAYNGRSPAMQYAGSGPMQSLGTLSGDDEAWAHGINDSGVIVGNSDNTTTGHKHAFIYQNGVMTDLNSLLPAGSPWELVEARDINNQGWIVGWGYLDGVTAVQQPFVIIPPDAIVGTIQFENYTGTTKVLVQVDLTPSGGGSTTSQDVIIPAAGGTFNLPVPAPGTYDVAFKGCSWLRKVVTGVSVLGPITLPPVTLVNGDTEGNNAITPSDLSIVLAGMDQTGQ